MSEERERAEAQGEMPAGYSIAGCVVGERTDQAELFNACFTKNVSETDLEWRYSMNPHGESVNLLAREEDGGMAVSGYACNPRLAVADGVEAIVGQTGDVMTHPERRKLGVFSFLDREAMRRTRAATKVDDSDLIAMCYMSEDFRTGMEAFLSKGKPTWSGK